MPEPNYVDVYADRCNVVLLPFGASIVFSQTKMPPTAPNLPPEAQHQAIVRMSIEHIKAMTMILWRQIRAYEDNIGQRTELCANILKDLGIPDSEWRMFWYGEEIENGDTTETPIPTALETASS